MLDVGRERRAPGGAPDRLGDPARFARLPGLARQLAVADFTAVYLALALDNERALRS